MSQEMQKCCVRYYCVLCDFPLGTANTVRVKIQL